jgi:hypothetical protein
MLKYFCCASGWYPENVRKLISKDPDPKQFSILVGDELADAALLFNPKIKKLNLALVSLECRGASVEKGNRLPSTLTDIPTRQQTCRKHEERDGVSGALRAFKRDFDTFNSLWESLNQLLNQTIAKLKETIFNEEQPSTSATLTKQRMQ